jgi:hypothetical protein
MCDAIGDAGFRDGSNGIATTDDHDRAPIGGFGDSASDTDCALVEWWFFEHAHRAVPNDRLRIFQSVRKVHHRLDTDVHARVSSVREFDWDSLRDNLAPFTGS